MQNQWAWPSVGKRVSGDWGGSRLPSFLCFTYRNVERELMEEVEQKVTELKIKEVENISLKGRLAKEMSTRMELEKTAKDLASSLEELMTTLEEKEGVNGRGGIRKPRLEKLKNKKGLNVWQGKESKDRFGGGRIITAEKSLGPEVECRLEMKYLRDKLEKEMAEKDRLKKRVDELGKFLRHWHADFMSTRSAYKAERKLRMALQVEIERLREQLQQERGEPGTHEGVCFGNAGNEFEEQGGEIESGLSYKTSEPSETPHRDSQAIERGEQQRSMDHSIARTVETGGTCGACVPLQLVSDEEGACVSLQSVGDEEGSNLGSWHPGKQLGMVERSRAESVGNGDGNGSEKALGWLEEMFVPKRLLAVDGSCDLSSECDQLGGLRTGKAEEETGVGVVGDDMRRDEKRAGGSTMAQGGEDAEMRMTIPEITGGASMGLLDKEVTSTERRELSSPDCHRMDTMKHLEAERESFGTIHESKEEGTRFVRSRGLPQAVLKEMTSIIGGDGEYVVATMKRMEPERESFVTTGAESEERGTGLVRTRGLPQAVLNGMTVTIHGEREYVKQSESGKSLESGNNGIVSREDSGPIVKIVLREAADLLLPVPQEMEPVQLGKEEHVHLERGDGEGIVHTAAGNATSNNWWEEVTVPAGDGKNWEAHSSAVACGEKMEKMQISSFRTCGPFVPLRSTAKAPLAAHQSSAQRLQWGQPGVQPLPRQCQQDFQGMQCIPEDLLLSDKLSRDLLYQPDVSSSDEVRPSPMNKLQGVSTLSPRGDIVAPEDIVEETDVGEDKDGVEEKNAVPKDSSEDIRTAPAWQMSSKGMNSSFLSRGVFAPVMREPATAGGVSNTINVGGKGVSAHHQLAASMSKKGKIEGSHFPVHRVSLSPSKKPVSSSEAGEDSGDCEMSGSVSTICPRLEGESVATSGVGNEEGKENDKQKVTRQSAEAGGPNDCDAAGNVWRRTDTPDSYIPTLETATGGSLPPGPPSAIRGAQLQRVNSVVVDLRSKLGMEVSTRIKLERQLNELKTKLLESLSSNSAGPDSRTLLVENTSPSGISDQAHFSPICRSEVDLLTSNGDGNDSSDHKIRELEAMISQLNDKVSNLTEELYSARGTIDNIAQSRDLSLLKVASLRGKLGAVVRMNGKLQTMFESEAH